MVFGVSLRPRTGSPRADPSALCFETVVAVIFIIAQWGDVSMSFRGDASVLGLKLEIRGVVGAQLICCET